MKEFEAKQLDIVAVRPRVAQLEQAKGALDQVYTPENKRGINIVIFALEWPMEKVWVEKSA